MKAISWQQKKRVTVALACSLCMIIGAQETQPAPANGMLITQFDRRADQQDVSVWIGSGRLGANPHGSDRYAAQVGLWITNPPLYQYGWYPRSVAGAGSRHAGIRKDFRGMIVVKDPQLRKQRGGEEVTLDFSKLVYAAPPKFRVVNAQGEQVAVGTFEGSALSLPAGQYTLYSQRLGSVLNRRFVITAGQNTILRYDLTSVRLQDLNQVSAEPGASPGGYCVACGHALRVGDRFCSNCGTKRVTPE